MVSQLHSNHEEGTAAPSLLECVKEEQPKGEAAGDLLSLCSGDPETHCITVRYYSCTEEERKEYSGPSTGSLAALFPL